MPGRLRRVVPFDQLSSEQLIVVAGRASIARFRDGQVVLAKGSDDDNDYFLLEGEVAITDAEGETRLIAGGTSEAANVISPLRPSLYDVRATGQVLCATLPRAEVSILREHFEDNDEMSIEEVSDDLSATLSLVSDLENDIAADRLRLPSLPDIALRLRDVLSSSACDNQRVADLIAADPSVAAKILKIANSPLRRGTEPIVNLRDAVGRIGMHTVSELIICFSLRDLFDTSSRSIRDRFAQLVGVSVRIGATASVIAERAKLGNADHALVAGLLSNIGAFPILERVAMRPDVVEDPTKADVVIETHSARIGQLMCKKWNLGDEVIEAISEIGNWAFVSHGALTIAEIVICAHYHTLLGLGQVQGLPKPERIKAMRVLGGNVTAETSMEIIKDAKARVDVLLDALS